MIESSTKQKVAIIGARGYVGNELLQLLALNERVEVVAVSSRSAKGQRVADHIRNYPDKQLCFSVISPAHLKSIEANVFFLALPNKLASDYVSEIEKMNKEAVIIDISADYRFDNKWVYGLPELNREQIVKSQRIANPGCYATAAMLALLPIKDYLIAAPNVFGVSGYSGAGKTPSDKNNPEHLQDNFLPYKLAGHIHENEVSYQLGKIVNFMPHVAPHFRGLSVTVNACLNDEFSVASLQQQYIDYYSEESLVRVVTGIPEVVDVANKVHVNLGGFAIDTRVQARAGNNNSNIRLVCVLDNLLKGAASQAMQNMNLALGIPEYSGLNE